MHLHLLQVAQLQSPELSVRLRALLAAMELLKVPQCYVQCLEANIAAALTDLLKVSSMTKAAA